MTPKKVSVTVRYSKPGISPPVFLAGTFSDWQLEEMQYSSVADNEYEFHKEVQIEEGREYQYKFRIGEGDWWVLNEDSPSGTDNAGNRNNLLTAPITEEAQEANKKSSGPIQEERSVPPAKKMENLDTKSIEERMGTREPSDVLFDDEIVKDPAEIMDVPLQASSQTGLFDLKPSGLQTKSENAAIKATEPKKDIKQKMIDEVPQVTLTIEESDAQRDEGSRSLLAKKEDHLHIHDAEPGYIMIEDRSRTPEFAKTAAEVAESAATLDPREPTPPISDEEAGRIGFRRMSRTPIPEVAKTAAEVADVAATLDRNTPTPPISEDEAGHTGYRRIYGAPIPVVAATAADVANVSMDLGDDPLQAVRAEFEASLTPEEREYLEKGTPVHEQVPRFPHELPPSMQVDSPKRKPVIDIPGPSPNSVLEAKSSNLPLKPFPTDRAAILEHLNEMQERLPEDEVNVDIEPAPEAVIVDRSAYESSPAMLQKEYHQDTPIMTIEEDNSPSLSAIVEESTEEHTGIKVAASVERIEEAASTPTTGPTMIGAKNTVTSTVLDQTDATEGDEAVAGPVGIQKQRGNDGNSKDQKYHKNDHVDPQAWKSSLDAVNTSNGRDLAEQTQPSLNPPSTKGDRQLKHGDEAVESGSCTDNPKFEFIPATPAGSSIHATDSSDTPKNKETDKVKSTAIEEGSGLIRARKQGQPPNPERPLTPNSVRSAGKDAHERNFLKAFWRVVFVDWIGGLILRICGGGRRQNALLAVGTVAALALAPALYYLKS